MLNKWMFFDSLVLCFAFCLFESASWWAQVTLELTHLVTQDSLKLTILLPQPPEYWHYKHAHGLKRVPLLLVTFFALVTSSANLHYSNGESCLEPEENAQQGVKHWLTLCNILTEKDRQAGQMQEHRRHGTVAVGSSSCGLQNNKATPQFSPFTALPTARREFYVCLRSWSIMNLACFTWEDNIPSSSWVADTICARNSSLYRGYPLARLPVSLWDFMLACLAGFHHSLGLTKRLCIRNWYFWDVAGDTDALSFSEHIQLILM